MSNKNLTIGVVVAIVIAIIGCFSPSVQKAIVAGTTGIYTNYAGLASTATLTGPGCGDAYSTCAPTITGSSIGLIQNGNLATTTPASMTMAATDFTGGYATISDLPNVGSITLTLPASSTMSTFLPSVGDTKSYTLFNASSTAAITVTLAGGTGTILEDASTTKAIGPLKAATVTVFRSTDSDLVFLMNPYI